MTVYAPDRPTYFVVVEAHAMPEPKRVKKPGRKRSANDQLLLPFEEYVMRDPGPNDVGPSLGKFAVIDLGLPIIGAKRQHVKDYVDLESAKLHCDMLNTERYYFLMSKGAFLHD